MIFVQISSLAKVIIHKCLPKARHSSVFSLGFSFLIFLFLTSALLTGCGSTNHIQTEIVKDVKRDAIYLFTGKYDSIYIAHDRDIDRSCDTLIKLKLIV